MFYCVDCSRRHGWPKGIVLSNGPCESCRQIKPCYNVASSQLPARGAKFIEKGGQYVNGWLTGDARGFTFTEHKGLAHRWSDHCGAYDELALTVPDPAERAAYKIVPAVTTPYDEAVAGLLTMSPEQRKAVISQFCPECYDVHSPHCRRDLDLA